MLLIMASCTPTEDNNGGPEAAGSENANAIENIKLEILDNDSMSLSSLNGKTVILDFWASWCGPCRNSIPFYNKMQEKYGEKGLVVIGINVNENESTVRKAIEDLGITYYVAMPNNTFNTHFQVQGIPSMYLFDTEGNLIDNFVGYAPQLDNKIESLIMENIK